MVRVINFYCNLSRAHRIESSMAYLACLPHSIHIYASIDAPKMMRAHRWWPCSLNVTLVSFKLLHHCQVRRVLIDRMSCTNRWHAPTTAVAVRLSVTHVRACDVKLRPLIEILHSGKHGGLCCWANTARRPIKITPAARFNCCLLIIKSSAQCP